MSTPAVVSDPYASIAVPLKADPYAAIAKPMAAAPAAPKSLLQKAQDAFDAFTTVTPDQEKGHSAVVNRAQEFGAGAVQGAFAPVVHPLDTLNGIGSAIAHPVNTATAMIQQAKDHPAQALGNLVGGVVAGEGAAAAAKAVNSVASPAIQRAALLGKTPAEAYESALRPPVTLDAEGRASAVRGGLENAIPLSKDGLEKIADRLDELNQGIKDEIAVDPTRPIDPNKVATRADAARARFAKQVNAQPDLNAIEASRQQFLSEQGQKPGVPAQPTGLVDAQGNPIMRPAQPATPAPPMNAADAQAMKQGTYRVLAGKFGEQGSAAVEAQKSLARGLKEELVAQFPEIGELNAQESRLLDLQPLVERAVNRSANQGMFRLGTGAVAGTFKALGSSNKVAAVAAVMKQVLDDPAIKARLAISLSKGAKIPYAQAAARVGAYSSALGATSSAPQGYSSDGSPSQSTSAQP